MTATAAFGQHLRTWRQHRRMSQLDLAAEAAVSTRHLSFLETGRSQPSREMVLHLADRLEIPLAQRNVMLAAAGLAPAYPDRPLDDVAMAPVREAVERLLAAHEPYPAVVVDSRWDLVAANSAAAPFLTMADPALLADPTNVYRLSLHRDGLARYVTNFDEYAAHLVGRLRRQVEATADPDLRDLLDEVLAYPHMEAVAPPSPRHSVVLPIEFRHPEGPLNLFSAIATFGAPNDVTVSGLAIESFFPADESSRALLQKLSEPREPPDTRETRDSP